MDTEAPAAALAGAQDLEEACRIAVAALAADGDLAVAAYVGRAGRLRCLAAAGTTHVLDGVSAIVGPVGRTAATGAEQRTLGPDGAETAGLPLIQRGEVIGVVSVEAPGTLSSDQLDAALGDGNALTRALAVGPAIVAGIAVYWAAVMAMRVAEARQISDFVRARLRPAG